VENRVIGIAVSGAWYAEKKFVSFSDISVFGVDAVLIRAAEAARLIHQVQEARPFLDSEEPRRVRRALSESGQILGSLTDGSFDPETAEIVRFCLETPDGAEAAILRSSVISSSRAVVILNDPSSSLPHRGIEPTDRKAVSLRETGISRKKEAKTREAEPIRSAFERASPEPIAETRSNGATSEMHQRDARLDPAPPPVGEKETKADRRELKKTEDEEAQDVSASVQMADSGEEEERKKETAEREPSAVASTPPERAGAAAISPSSGTVLGVNQLKERINANPTGAISFLADKYCDRDITNDEGETLICEGDRITPDLATTAFQAGKLYDLWLAAQDKPAAKEASQ
jgi:hypothetical protein